MNRFKQISIGLLYTVSAVLVLCSLLSLLRNSSVQYFKMLDFPRIQFFLVSAVCLIFILILKNNWDWSKYVLSIGLVAGLIINSVFLLNYTPLVAVDVPAADSSKVADSKISILLANVKMTNRESADLKKVIAENNPDLILGMEVDAWWDDQLKYLKKDYPYSQHTINKETYGMLVYSKFPLENINVAYLNNKNVPSFECMVTLKSGLKIDLHCLHPVPPTDFKALPDNAGQKEKALLKLGRELEGETKPIIVAGDLNDAVWSRVDQLTGTENLLSDVRVGRGFYNTFNATNPLMRWPLDHVFVTKEFRLRKIERLRNVGSDHFPLFVELSL